MASKSFDELVNGYVNNQLTPEEQMHFLQLVEQDAYRDRLEQHILSMLETRPASGLANESRREVLIDNILAMAHAGNEASAIINQPAQPPVRKMLWRYVAAAAVLVGIVAGVYMWTSAPAKQPVAATKTQAPVYKNDVMPGSQKATLTLGNGNVITLDDASNGTLAKQGATNIIKIDGKINYEGTNVAAETMYNTVATPRGGQYQVALPDGSMVWLNAASSIHFPTAFNGKERVVDISGEAYFEVAKNKDKPFIVNVNGSQVKVLGTHFNVMAYNDESALETTLQEGAVAFTNNNRTVVLKPLEQSKLLQNGKLDVAGNIDVDDVLSWKNGMFHITNLDIQAVMRQLSRWYDVEIEYRNKPDHDVYDLEMPRNSKLSSILKVLQIMGNLHFDIDGRKIIVS